MYHSILTHATPNTTEVCIPSWQHIPLYYCSCGSIRIYDQFNFYDIIL